MHSLIKDYWKYTGFDQSNSHKQAQVYINDLDKDTVKSIILISLMRS